MVRPRWKPEAGFCSSGLLKPMITYGEGKNTEISNNQ
jgi:hypothetical protein